MNPIQLLQNFMMKGFSPQKIVEQVAGKNPMLANLMKMANSGDSRGVESFARNMLKEKGRNFDEEFSAFRKNFK